MNSVVKKLKRRVPVRCRVSARPKFEESDFKYVTDLQELLPSIPYRSDCWQSSTYTEDIPGDEHFTKSADLVSIRSYSTTATMDDNPGTGRLIDKPFYQPVGRAIEKFALQIGLRLNICHPSPAHILRYVLGLYPEIEFWFGDARRQSDVMKSICAEEPTLVPGLLNLVKQSQ